MSRTYRDIDPFYNRRIPCTRDNVLGFLKGSGPSEPYSIGMRLDSVVGNVYPPSVVLRVLRSLERDGLARHDGDTWEATESNRYTPAMPGPLTPSINRSPDMARKQLPKSPKAKTKPDVTPVPAPKIRPPGPTVPRQFRFTDATLAKIDDLAKRLGPVVPLTRSDVLRVAVARLWEAEFGSGEAKR